MNALLLVCAVLVTLSALAITVVLVRAMSRLEVATDEFKKTAEVLRSSVAEAITLSHEVQDLAGSFKQEFLPPLRRSAARLEAVTERASRLSQSLLHEVERPIHDTVALIAGIRAGTRSLVGALARREPHVNGGRHDA